MSTLKAHKERVQRRRRLPVQKAKDQISAVYPVVRPLVLLASAIGGSWLMVHQLRTEVWHHNAPVWLFALVLAGAGFVGLYKEVAHRVRLRRWLRADDPERVLHDEPEVRQIVQRLPPWHHRHFVAKRQEAKEQSGKRSVTTTRGSRRVA